MTTRNVWLAGGERGDEINEELKENISVDGLLLTRASKWSLGETNIRALRLSAVGMLTSLSLKMDRSPFDLTSTRHRSSAARFSCNLSAAIVLMLSAVLVTENRSVQYV